MFIQTTFMNNTTAVNTAPRGGTSDNRDAVKGER